MVPKSLVGEEVVSLSSIINGLQESAGDMMALSDKTNFERCPHPIQFELVSSRGEIFGPCPTAQAAAEAARAKWPNQEQDEDRTGDGWSIWEAANG